MAVKEPTGDLKKACWKGYTAVGMKMKNGRKVPNCVPANEEKENYGLPAHSMKHVMQKIKDGHWEVSSGEVKSGQHLSIIDHTKGKKKRMIHVKEESNEPKDREWGTTKLTKRYKKDTPGQCDCDTMKEESDQITEDAKRDRVSADLHKQGIGSHWRNPQVLVVHDKHKKKVQKYMDEITGGWVHVVGHSEEPMNEEAVGRKRYKVGLTISHPDVASGNKKDVRVNVNASSQQKAIETAEKHYRNAGYKVHKDLSFIHSVNEEAGQMDEGITKAINKKNKNAWLAMQGRKSLGEPEKDLTWQQNKANAVKAGRAQQTDPGDELQTPHHIGVTSGSSTSGPRLGTDIRSVHQNRNVVKQGKRAGKLNKGTIDSLKRRIRSRRIDEATTATIGVDDYGYNAASVKTARGGNPEKILHLPVNRIQVHEPDTKFDDPEFRKHVDKIKAALRRGEQTPPITVRRMPGTGGLGYQVIDGHHRFKAHRELGIKHIPVHIVPKYNVTDLHSGEESEKIDEVLSKDASAGDWIHDFVHSKNPKFAGKSKTKRMKMALAAYYAKQRNEEVEQIDELKRDTMISYVGKARKENIKNSAKNRLAGVETSLSDIDKASAKTSKRSKGIQRAYARLNKEEVEQIDEVAFYGGHALGQLAADHPHAAAAALAATGAAAAYKYGKHLLARHKELKQLKNEVPNWSNQKLISHKNNAKHGGKFGEIVRGELERRKNTKQINEEVEQMKEATKWRTHPDAHFRDTDGSILPKTHGRVDKLKLRSDYLSTAKDYVAKKIKNPKNAKKQLQQYAKSGMKFHVDNKEVDQIDELKKSTMASYIPKATASYGRDKQLIGRESPDGTVAKARPELKRSVKNRLAGIQRASQKLAKEEVEQISEGPQRDATRAKNKLKDAISGANYKRTGAPVPDAEPQHKTAQAHNKAIGRSLRKMEEGTRDLTAALAKKIEKKTGGKETAVRNKAGLLVTKKKSKAKLEEATGEDVYKDLRAQGVPHHVAMSRAKEHEERSKSRDYQGYHTQIHVDGRHYKAGDRIGMGERGAQDAARHATNIAKKTGKKVSIHMIHHETGKTLAIADYTDGKWKYRNLSEEAHHPIPSGHKNTSGGKSHGNTAQRHDLPITPRRGEYIAPKPGVKVDIRTPHGRKPKPRKVTDVLILDPPNKPRRIKETRNIIREVIRKAVDKQETNRANGKTATGEPAPKIKINPVLDIGTNRGIGGT